VLGVACSAQWSHQSTSGSQLSDQGRWNLLGRGGQEHAIKGRSLRPSQVAIPLPEKHVHEAEPLEALARKLCQLRDDFDRVHLGAKERQHRRLVSGASANFEHPFVPLQVKLLGHVRHDVGLTDRLAVADRDGSVGRGLSCKKRRNEVRAIEQTNGVEHALVDDSPFAKHLRQLVITHDAYLAIPLVIFTVEREYSRTLVRASASRLSKSGIERCVG